MTVATKAGQMAVSAGGFAPSGYVSTVSTSTSAGAEPVPARADLLRVVNLDSTNLVKLAFGDSEADAKSNAENGLALLPEQEIYLRVPRAATYFGYEAAAGTPDISITFGL